MRSKAVVGNWKLNGSLVTNEALLKALLGDDNSNAKALILYARCLTERGELEEARVEVRRQVGRAVLLPRVVVRAGVRAPRLPVLRERGEARRRGPARA